MTVKNDSGPAFPANVPAGDCWRHVPGMTLRDYFAAKAIQGTLANSAYHDDSTPALAKWAYELADALIAERSKEEPKGWSYD
jgi:hypothetical protein